MASTTGPARAWLSCLSFAILLALSFWLRPVSLRVSGDEVHVRSLSDVPIIQLPSHSIPSVYRREDYTCSVNRPCSNGACCGESGNSGYGSVYCGAGCTSNCNATAECGQIAAVAGIECPLNTCCSEFGFCGTTDDFCTGNCQSNCELDPLPPSSSPRNQALSKAHPESLFQLTVDAKKYNSQLKVFISVGGWTFSDNDTATQPLFGEVASTQANRQKFADNTVKIMNKYGFDGLDNDWEYPGAPDRGGTPEDTENFTLLMKVLRSTFNAAPRSLGLTLTTPSSYWYLKWFGLPGLLKYADWTNLMTYDLHGTWDENSPIGAIVQGHTNLAEIQLAAQLFWRAGIKPAQIVMGLGFYGRSFQLSDDTTSGILEYYEIQAILTQIPDLKPVIDETAAVKYIVFDSDQWVSYDDEDTFGTKIAWANAVGIGGLLIWAVDTDDDQFTTMSDFMGKAVSHVDTVTPELDETTLAVTTSSVISSLVGENGQDCKVLKDYSCKNKDDLRCGTGETMIGWDRDGCSDSNYGKPICCPEATAPSNFLWRGGTGGRNCNGQFHVGEATLFQSHWGGGGFSGIKSESGTNQCGAGEKVFCCEAGDWKDVVDGCHWTEW
ncbi:Uu.00g115190.m01.CDS01 [Anthostomella pinea]|uniref:chitinase n=1 Tax=Anthostomella pinea TaxID=933095 RepID=A0AAI8YGM1_9PEZI|nr:Uu.00g115190.m01.CDS01 [Anthostomella pinea]